MTPVIQKIQNASICQVNLIVMRMRVPPGTHSRRPTITGRKELRYEGLRNDTVRLTTKPLVVIVPLNSREGCGLNQRRGPVTPCITATISAGANWLVIS
jgi:hypothetical protein